MNYFRSKWLMFRKRLLVYLAHEIALPYFKLVRKGYHFPYSIKDLQGFPQGTVGFELFRFFQEHQLKMLPHYEKHDIKHVVLDFPPNETGEVCLQTFMLANGRITLPVVVSVLIGWLIMPEKWHEFMNAWSRGRMLPSLNKLDWFALIPKPITEVRNQIFNHQTI